MLDLLLSQGVINNGSFKYSISSTYQLGLCQGCRSHMCGVLKLHSKQRQLFFFDYYIVCFAILHMTRRPPSRPSLSFLSKARTQQRLRCIMSSKGLFVCGIGAFSTPLRPSCSKPPEWKDTTGSKQKPLRSQPICLVRFSSHDAAWIIVWSV